MYFSGLLTGILGTKKPKSSQESNFGLGDTIGIRLSIKIYFD